MAKAKSKKSQKTKELPDMVYVYVCDYDNGEPILAASVDLDGIPEDAKFREYSGGASGEFERNVRWL